MRTLVAMLVVGLMAAPTLAINNPHAAGSMQGWNAGSDPMAETPPDSGIYTITFTDLDSNGRYEWKVTDGTWDETIPVSNSWFFADSNGDITLTYDSNGYEDDWSPTYDRLGLSTDPEAGWTAVGNWQNQVGGDNWDNDNPNTKMLHQGGGIYKLEVTLTPGVYDWKAVVTGSWDSISWDSRSTGTANWSFTADAVHDTITFWVDSYTGTAKIEGDVEPVDRMSRLDGLYLAKEFVNEYEEDDILHVGVVGNLENNGSAMVIFINTVNVTGQDELRADGIGGDPPQNMLSASKQIDLLSCDWIGDGTSLPGEADYALYVNLTEQTYVYLNEFWLFDTEERQTLSCCDGTEFSITAEQWYVGNTPANDGDDVISDPELRGYIGGFDDSNTCGMTSDPLTGLEIGIPAYHIGGGGLGRDEAFEVFVWMMPNNDGVQGQFSNQALPATTNGFCDPPQMFPLRADVGSFTGVHSVTKINDLPNFGGGDNTADGVIDPDDYGTNGPVEVQTCEIADPEPDHTVSLQPYPVQGQDSTVWYVSTNGPLEDATEVYMNYGFDGGALSNSVAMTATNGLTGSEWIATVNMDSGSLQFDVNFNSNGTYHDNTGQNWHFRINRSLGDAVVIDPDPAEAGQTVKVTYNAVDRPLMGADQVCLHYGFNGWNPTMDDEMMTSCGPCEWEVDVDVPYWVTADSNGLNIVFNDCGNDYDNNGGNDWNFEVINTTGTPESQWVMDGYLDACATLIDTSSNGDYHLYAGLRDGFFYVATERAQAGNDHFLFVSTNGAGTPVGAPWSKAGTVAQWDMFLVQEENNGYTAWTDLAPWGTSGHNSQNMDRPYLEGFFDMTAQFGDVDTIYLAMGPYTTPDAGVLVPSLQIIPGNHDGNIDANEYCSKDPSTIEVGTGIQQADFDCDGDVDLDDYDIFEQCLNGPGNGAAGTCPGGVDADLEGDDDDVDLADFAAFQRAFGT